MKRDLDIQVQSLELIQEKVRISSVKGHSKKAFCYNARQLYTQGLITPTDAKTLVNPLDGIVTVLNPKDMTY